MSIQINYKNNNTQKSQANLILFTDENYNIDNLKKYISIKEFSINKDISFAILSCDRFLADKDSRTLPNRG